LDLIALSRLEQVEVGLGDAQVLELADGVVGLEALQEGLERGQPLIPVGQLVIAQQVVVPRS
jgi:hypothetical protein